MKKIYNDQSNSFADWTTKKLKQEAKEYYSLIYGEASCYGTSDLRVYDGICQELDSRGVVSKTKLVLC
jgi:hypothetical protein